MSVDPLTMSRIATKTNSLSDDELEFSKSDSSLKVTLRALPLFLLKLKHSLLK
jgi:hypothetical protein